MEKITLNMTPTDSLATCHASQYDIGRQVAFNLVNGSDAFILSGAETVTLKIKRADGVLVESEIPNTASSSVIWTSAAGECDAAGLALCKLIVTEGADVLGSATFKLEVEADAYEAGALVIREASGDPAVFETDLPDVAAGCVIDIGYNANGYTCATVLNSETAPAFDSVPYIFRKSGGDLASIGAEEFDKITGGTVAFNQNCQVTQGALLENVATKTYSGGVWTFTATDLNSDSVGWYAEYPVNANHICFIAVDVNPTNSVTMKLGMIDRTLFNVSGGAYTRIETLRKQDVEARPVCYAMLNGQGFNSFSFSCKNVNFIDLTQMLGASVADYIYTLETSTPGAGVAWFRKLFPADYYDYNPGELLSVKTSAHVTRGFNAWDEEWENGQFDSSGNPSPNNNVIRSKNFIPVLGGENYYFLSGGNWIYVCQYDANKNFIGTREGFGGGSKTLLNNCCFIRFNLSGSYGATYNNDICINLQSNRDGEYEPYEAHTYALDDLELRGIPKLDASNRLYYDGDTYESDGHVSRRFGVVDLGALDYAYYGGRFNTVSAFEDIGGEMSGDYYVNVICARYVNSSSASDKTFFVYNNKYIYIYDSDYTDATALKNSLDGVYLVYELSTPEDESADPFSNPQAVSSYGTEEYTDSRAVPIPVGHFTAYGDDIKATIVNFGTRIYGGSLNLTTGTLTSTLNPDGTTKGTPDVYQITPAAVEVREGDNQVFGNTDGDAYIQYYEKA